MSVRRITRLTFAPVETNPIWLDSVLFSFTGLGQVHVSIFFFLSQWYRATVGNEMLLRDYLLLFVNPRRYENIEILVRTVYHVSIRKSIENVTSYWNRRFRYA